MGGMDGLVDMCGRGLGRKGMYFVFLRELLEALERHFWVSEALADLLVEGF